MIAIHMWKKKNYLQEKSILQEIIIVYIMQKSIYNWSKKQLHAFLLAWAVPFV